MIYKASKLIAEAFDEHGIKYGCQIEEHGDSSAVAAGFRIDNGPLVMARFFPRMMTILWRRACSASSM